MVNVASLREEVKPCYFKTHPLSDFEKIQSILISPLDNQLAETNSWLFIIDTLDQKHFFESINKIPRLDENLSDSNGVFEKLRSLMFRYSLLNYIAHPTGKAGGGGSWILRFFEDYKQDVYVGSYPETERQEYQVNGKDAIKYVYEPLEVDRRDSVSLSALCILRNKKFSLKRNYDSLYVRKVFHF